MRVRLFLILHALLLAAAPLHAAQAVRALAFSPDGKYLAATSAEPNEIGHATVWEMPSGKLVFSHKEPKGIPSVAFAPDGKHLVIGTFTENALVVDTTTWTIARRLAGHGNAARGVAFSHDGKTLAISSYDGFVKLWETAAWTNTRTLANLHTNWIYTVAITKDGTTLATGSADDTAKLWDLGTGKNLHTFHHDGLVRRLLFTPDDWHLIYGSWDGSVVIRDRRTGASLASFDRFGTPYDVALARDGKVLAFVAGGSARLLAVDLSSATDAMRDNLKRLMKGWDDDDLEVRNRASKQVAALGMPALGELRRVAKEATDPEIRLRARLARSAILAPAPLFHFRHLEGEMESVAFAPTGRIVATGGVQGVVRIWNLEDGREMVVLRQFPAGEAQAPRSKW
jgi:WD40 repeat protein